LVLRHRAEEGFPPARLAEKIFEVRGRVGKLLGAGRQVRELLFLDLALEATLRTRVEQSLEPGAGMNGLVDLIRWTLENFAMTHGSREMELCLKHWRLIARASGAGPEWALETGALVERLTRGLAEFAEAMRGRLQPKAEFLGQAFGVDAWSRRLFSEEVVRGTLASVLSVLLQRIGPLLRKAAQLGDWEVVSPGAGRGRLERAATLEAVQGKRYDRPTVILAERLSGYEEIPEGVGAIVTPHGVDVLSHLAIRARNAGILFAVCHDRDTLDRLRFLEGEGVRLAVNGVGDVRFEKDEEAGEGGPVPRQRPPVPLPWRALRALGSGCAVPLDRFEERVVGRKSLNLRRLAEHLPSWISVPGSVAVPFGSFERVLEAAPNRELARRYERLAERADEDPGRALEELRQAVLSLEPPEGWLEALATVMEKAGLPRPEDLEGAWTCVKRVWASIWNRRAFLSRKARGMDHGSLQMAVLIQEVVNADYGFVLHTANPVSQSRDEVYAEVVLGLGETLVGNHPGNALRMVCPKRADKPRLIAFPSKSIGLYGTGLIFRSDSSGEDLSGFAGAGLYDSFLLKPPDPVRLDYAAERLVRDEAFREDLARQLTRVGVAIEDLFGAPQDIEGVLAGGRVHVVQSRPQVGFADA
jgi:alpha-glucan,water dikinase